MLTQVETSVVSNSQEIPPRRVFSTAEARRILGLSISTMWRLRKSGRMNAVRIGGRNFYTDAEIARISTFGTERSKEFEK